MAVGVFDSGLGGLTVLDAVQKRLPDVPFVYYGDNAHAPYGVRTADDVAHALRAGADKVSMNSAIVTRPELLTETAERFGAQCVVASIDAKRDANGVYKVWVKGGREETPLEAVAWAQECVARGAGEILLTSMDRDGTRDGFDIALTHAVSSSVGVPVIASGGVGTLDHLAEGVLQGGATGVLAASIFHFGEHTIAEAKSVMSSRGVRVRPVAS